MTNETRKELLETLNGCEVESIEFEDIVYIAGESIISNGKVIVKRMTNKQLSILLHENFYNEYGYYDVSRYLSVNM